MCVFQAVEALIHCIISEASFRPQNIDPKNILSVRTQVKTQPSPFTVCTIPISFRDAEVREFGNHGSRDRRMLGESDEMANRGWVDKR